MNAVCLRSSSIIDMVALLSVSESNMTFLFRWYRWVFEQKNLNVYVCREMSKAVNKFFARFIHLAMYNFFFKWPLVLTFFTNQIVNRLEYSNHAMRRSGYAIGHCNSQLNFETYFSFLLLKIVVYSLFCSI